MEWTLPHDVSGQSIKGDLDQEYRQLQDSSPEKSFRGWYLREALMLGTGIAASLIPAARATRVDPVEALKQD